MNKKELLEIYKEMIWILNDSTEDYLYVYNLEDDRVYYPDKICEKYSISSGREGVPISEWEKIVYPAERKQLEQSLNDIRNGISRNHDMEYRLVDKLGNKVWINCRGNVVNNEEDRPLFLLGTVSEMVMKRVVDRITGLWNSEKFIEDMKKSLKENDGFLMVLGVDNFKTINISHGVAFGNQLLKNIARLLEEHSDASVKIYRISGDCFAVDFKSGTKEDVQAFYSVIKEELKGQCTASGGALEYSANDGRDVATVCQYAEIAMQQAKKDGKDRLRYFSYDDYKNSLDEILLQEEIQMAINDNCKGFFLCYQPQIDTENFKLYGMEALLRYESPSRGIVSPVQFIPFLEKSGLICTVGDWALYEALRQCAHWRQVYPDLNVNVNISCAQLWQENITERVIDALCETKVPGSALTLEVTESMKLQDYDYFNKIFSEWKRYGIKIAIDDFGTGYSGLNYLKSLNINEVKIDRSFVRRVYANVYNYRLLCNMFELARSAKLHICCEGVETEEEMIAVWKLKPDVIQGFFFGRPYTKEEFTDIYMNEHSERYRQRLLKEEKYRQMDFGENIRFMEEQWKDEIVNIVDGMDEIIYVSDMDSYDIYYMNPMGQKVTGVYDYKGLKCYKVFQGADEPCEDCNNKELKREEFRLWEEDNKFLGKHFLVKNKLIPWRGKMARLQLAIDISEQKAGEQQNL